MNYRKIIWAFAWFLATLGVIEIGFELITMPNTFLNIIGLCLMFAYSLISTDAEAYYNRTVSASLSNTLVQMKALEKWDGKTPIVSGGASTFIDAGKFVK